MGVLIHAPQAGRIRSLTVLEHTLAFDPGGTADGSVLTTAELDRLRRFHFRVEPIPDALPEPIAETTGEGSSLTPEPMAKEGATRRGRRPAASGAASASAKTPRKTRTRK